MRSSEKINAEQFKELFKQQWMHSFTTMNIWKGTEYEVPAIAYIQSLPYGINNKIQATMLILLDHDTILDGISSIEELKQGIFWILDEKNQVVATTGWDSNLLSVDYNEFENNKLGTSDQIVPIDEALSMYGIQLIGKKYLGLVTEVDDMMACLVNVDEQDGEKIEEELTQMAAQIQSIIRDNFYIHVTISVGGIHETIVGIPKSYQEAQEAMEYRMVMGSGRIIRYNEIENPSNRYDYPLKIEQQLINSIKLGNFKTAKSIINDVFEGHFSDGMPSIEMTKCLLFDLMNTMIKALNDINSPDSVSFIEELNPIARLLASNIVDEMKYNMMDILKRVCDHIESSKKDRNQKIIEQIISIIKNSYAGPNLSITYIAGQIGLTGPYISKMFKDQMGEGIQDYINKIRLKQAKKLLLEQNLNLEQTANKVGYSNSNALIRVFKKYEGVTPGQFRDMNR